MDNYALFTILTSVDLPMFEFLQGGGQEGMGLLAQAPAKSGVS